jgi:hypothetical protein
VLGDANITDNHKGTGWIQSLDPTYARIADLWMETLVRAVAVEPLQ